MSEEKMTKKQLAVLEKERKAQEKLQKERERIEVMKEFEYKFAEYNLICGIDEVGRGPLAGPVVTAAVILPKDKEILYLNDSKKLSEKKRDELYDEIMEKAVAVGIGCQNWDTIDDINILQATMKAMKEAVENMHAPAPVQIDMEKGIIVRGEQESAPIVPDLLLIDAVNLRNVDIKQVSIIKGDARSISIAAASIVAKVTRDRLMVEYDKVYPGYGFANNKGYGTAEHIEGLKKMGPTPIHRKTFIGNLM